MNPEQRTRSGFTARCCLSMWDVTIQAASGCRGMGRRRRDRAYLNRPSTQNISA